MAYYFIGFKHTNFSLIVGSVIFAISWIVEISGRVIFNSDHHKKTSIVITSASVAILSGITVMTFKNILDTQIDYLREHFEKDKEIVQIMNQLDENLLIIKSSDDIENTEYVNKRFLNDFKD